MSPPLTSAEHRTLECYSVTVNRAGTRLATGGLDGKVKVWDVSSVLHFKNHENDTKPAFDPLDHRMANQEVYERPVAQMSRHNGAVTCVKFSPLGRFLASGSDDKIVLIWEKDDLAPRPKQFGEAEAEVEHWTVRRRLVAHDNDVQDICWLPDGLLLITVGLDRSIIIWSGTTFERIKRYDVHQSMVKGIVFDPANKFFATASDDRTVRVFRYYHKSNDLASNYEFQLEHIVTDPFSKLPLTSYFRRMSWSPDGQHVAVPNATNGPVTSVAVVNRGDWATNVSLIGHEAPCEVCLFSPRIYRTSDRSDDEGEMEKDVKEEKEQNQKPETDEKEEKAQKDHGIDNNNGSGQKSSTTSHSSAPLTTILATGGQDRCLAIWSTARGKPLVVAEEIASGAITDICWTPDGQALFISSIDGLITCVSFEPGELGEVVSEDVVASQLVKYGGDRERMEFPESATTLALEQKARQTAGTATKSGTATLAISTNIADVALREHFPQLDSTGPVTLPDSAPSNAVTASSSDISAPRAIGLTTNSFASSATSAASSALGLREPVSGAVRSASELAISRSGSTLSASGVDARAGSISPSTIRRPAVKITRDGRKRVAPMLMTTPRAETTPVKSTTAVSNARLPVTSSNIPPLGIATAVSGLRVRDTLANLQASAEQADNDNHDIGEAHTALRTRKLLRLLRQLHLQLHARYPTPFRRVSGLPETLFADPTLAAHELKKLFPKLRERFAGVSVGPSLSHDDSYFRIIFCPVKTSAGVYYVEVRNGEQWAPDSHRADFQDPTQVAVCLENGEKYFLYYPARIQIVVPVVLADAEGGSSFLYIVFVTFDGTAYVVHAKNGSAVSLPIEIGANVVAVRVREQFVLFLTSAGLLHSWKFSLSGGGIEAVVKGISLAPILNEDLKVRKEPAPKRKKRDNDTPGPPAAAREFLALVHNLEALELHEDGTPLAMVEETSAVYKYSTDLAVWTKIVEPWYWMAGPNEETAEAEKLATTMSTSMQSLSQQSERFHGDQVARGEASSYIFNERNQELRAVMTARRSELSALF